MTQQPDDQPRWPSRRDLARLYGIAEDTSAELGSLAAEIDAGQLRSLLGSALGALSALQWYAVARLGGLPQPDDAAEAAEPPADGIDWPSMWELYTSANGGRASGNGSLRTVPVTCG